MRLPVDIRDIVKSGSQISEAREEAVRLAVFVEADAPDALIDEVQKALRPHTANARVHVEVAEPGTRLVVDPSADAVIGIVGSGHSGLAESLDGALARAVPAAAVALAEESAAVADILGHPYRDTLADMDPVKLVEEDLGEWLVERVGGKRLAMAHNFSFMRRAVALESVKNTAWQNGAIGAIVFMPGADMPLMTANQAKMLLQIAAAYGEEMGVERLKELVAIVGGGYLLRTVARQAVSLLPGVGWAIKAGIGATGTLAMGFAAIRYFEGGADISRLTEQFDRVKRAVIERTHRAKELPAREG